MTRGELLDRMDSREITEWLAYTSLEPIGERRADIRAASSDALLANIHTDPKKREKPYTLADFVLPSVDDPEPEPEPELTEEEQKANAERLANKIMGMLVPDAIPDEPELVPSLRG